MGARVSSEQDPIILSSCKFITCPNMNSVWATALAGGGESYGRLRSPQFGVRKLSLKREKFTCCSNFEKRLSIY
jgi:hypothetical protein